MCAVPRLAVVDASVVLKWQLDDEECIPQATALRDDFYLRGALQAIAPHLLVYEVANGIAVAARRRRLSPDRAAEAMDNLLTLGVEMRAVDPVLLLALALRHNLSAYDAAYLALAASEECELWTGDRALCHAMRGQPSLVRWIGDYSG